MIIFVIILVVLAALLLWLIFPTTRRHPDRRLLSGLYIAHRGLHDLVENTPENSLAAFRMACDNGFAIENDIHLTADCEVVVFHDDTTLRMCGIDRKVEEMTLAELKELRLGGTKEQIPTLRECLDLVNGRVPLLIEFKSVGGNANALCTAANEILKDYTGKYIIQSFYPPVVAWYRKNRKDICRGQLSEVFSKKYPAFYKLLSCLLSNVIARPDFVSYNFEHEGFIFRRLCVALGAMSVGWTFRSKKQVESVKHRFETYIFENFLPDKVREDA